MVSCDIGDHWGEGSTKMVLRTPQIVVVDLMSGVGLESHVKAEMRVL